MRFGRVVHLLWLWLLAPSARSAVAVPAHLSKRAANFHLRIQRLASTGGLLVIDTDNLRGKTGFSLSHESAVARVARWSRRENMTHHVALVVDHGTHHDARYLPNLGVGVVFAGQFLTADDVIARDVPYWLSVASSVLVITADAGLADRCRARANKEGAARLGIAPPSQLLECMRYDSKSYSKSSKNANPELQGSQESAEGERMGRVEEGEGLPLSEGEALQEGALQMSEREGEALKEGGLKMSEERLRCVEAEMAARAALLRAQRLSRSKRASASPKKRKRMLGYSLPELESRVAASVGASERSGAPAFAQLTRCPPPEQGGGAQGGGAQRGDPLPAAPLPSAEQRAWLCCLVHRQRQRDASAAVRVLRALGGRARSTRATAAALPPPSEHTYDRICRAEILRRRLHSTRRRQIRACAEEGGAVGGRAVGGRAVGGIVETYCNVVVAAAAMMDGAAATADATAAAVHATSARDGIGFGPGASAVHKNLPPLLRKKTPPSAMSRVLNKAPTMPSLSAVEAEGEPIRSLSGGPLTPPGVGPPTSRASEPPPSFGGSRRERRRRRGRRSLL